MTSKDKEIWQHYAQGLAPLPGKKRKLSPAKPQAEKTAARPSASTVPVKLPKLNSQNRLSDKVAQNLERSREKLLRQGDIAIDAKLDLHGMTQTEAFEALAVFMHRCVKNGKRHLLIITGKGREGAGVLRSNFKNWLGDLPEAPAILAIRPAAAKHGGSGAFYVLLRKS